ncbi:CapA family protein [Streptomyces sp. NPDC091292]|uniref:CapA family protein n=1 Tax=Streptomyces sp. NPDC091292 TaxID=3365991 RepID=UPI003803F4C0
MGTRTRQTVTALAVLLLGSAAGGCAGPESGPPSREHASPGMQASPGERPSARGHAPSGHPAPSGHHAPPGAAGPGAASSAPSGPRGFTLAAAGDVLPHDSVIRRAASDADGDGYDFRPMFEGVKSVVSGADVAICHMETTYGADGDYSGYPQFKSPPEVATGLRATGYDSCSTASNHTLDDGVDGVRRTLDALDRAGVRHAGSARHAADAKRPTWLQGGSAKIAHLAYTNSTNRSVPEGKTWSVNMLDHDKILADAQAARKAGADVVVVSLHWGTEWQDEPDEDQLTMGPELTASQTDGRPDIDLILGTHAHVPQAYQKVNGTWIVYGMGDQIAGDMVNDKGAWDSRGNQGTIARFTFAPPAEPGTRWVVKKAEFVPTWFDTDAGRVYNLATDDDAPGDVRDRISEVVLSQGGGDDGLKMGR